MIKRYWKPIGIFLIVLDIVVLTTAVSVSAYRALNLP